MVHDDGSSPPTSLRLERKEVYTIIGVLLGVLGAFATVMLFVFETKADASAARAVLDKKIALEKQERELRQEFADKEKKVVKRHLRKLDAVSQTTHDNVQQMMHRRGLTPAPLPAAGRVDLDDLDTDEDNP